MRRLPSRRMAYVVPLDLGERVDAVLEKIRRDSTPRAHAGELAEVIVDLTHAGLEAYFLAPLARVDVGTLTMGSARIGIAAAEKSLPTLVRKVIGKMTDEQIREIVEIIDEMIVRGV